MALILEVLRTYPESDILRPNLTNGFSLEYCPWHGFEPATISFCESSVCSWVTQPANTWSNIGFLIVGIYLYRLTKDSKSSLKLIGPSTILLAFGSGLFHASGAFFFEVFDLLGMFMISGMLLCFNLQRLFSLGPRSTGIIYWVLNALSVGLMLLWHPAGIPIFSTQLTIALTIEVLLHIRRDEISYRYLLMACCTFALSFAVWALDIAKVACIPENHILTGHAVWHFLNAFAIYNIYRFYRQFDHAKKGRFTLQSAEKGP